MNIEDRIKSVDEMELYLEGLRQLATEDPVKAKEMARESLIKTGVLNEDGSVKEHIVDEPHVGYDKAYMSYSDIVDTMKMCLEHLRLLGDNNPEKTHEITCRSLVAAGFIDKNGHVLVPEKRSPQVEEFFRRIEQECEASSRQRVRK